MGINYNRKILKRNNVISFTKLVIKNKNKLEEESLWSRLSSKKK